MYVINFNIYYCILILLDSPSLPQDSEQDLSLLLECLHFQQNCVTSQCQALSTIATMCNNSGEAKLHYNN